MNSLKPYEIGKEVEDILGEAVDLWEAEGRSELTLVRRAREALDRIEAWRDRPSGERMEPAEPESNEAEEMWAAQRAALERIASGVRPSGRGDKKGLTMLTVREARSIAQNSLHLSEDRASGKRAAKREAAKDAERLRTRALSGDLEGAEREARRILGRNETLDAGDQEDPCVHSPRRCWAFWKARSAWMSGGRRPSVACDASGRPGRMPSAGSSG